MVKIQSGPGLSRRPGDVEQAAVELGAAVAARSRELFGPLDILRHDRHRAAKCDYYTDDRRGVRPQSSSKARASFRQGDAGTYISGEANSNQKWNHTISPDQQPL
jgi:hypothetical protein